VVRGDRAVRRHVRLGLTVAQEVLTQHGFAFTLEGPRPEGEPTRFTIRF